MLPWSSRRAGFSRTDLLFTGAFASLLLSTCIGLTSREASQRAVCHNNLRQLGMAALEYAEENEDALPPRRSQPNTWIQRLKPYYKSDKLVQCPADAEGLAPHSYLINAFADFFTSGGYPNWLSAPGMKIKDVLEPSETILFGEKNAQSFHVYMDYANFGGNDFAELDHGRHYRTESRAGSGSNHAFVDGSVHLLPFGTAVSPINRWCVVPEYRNQPVIQETSGQ